MAEEIFNEIEEDLQKERFKKIWQNYRNYIISVIILVIISIGSFQLYNYFKFLSYQKASNQFASLLKLSQNNYEEALQFINEIENTPGGYADLLNFKKADLSYKIGQTEEANRILEAMYVNNSINLNYKNVALTMSILNQSPNENLIKLIDTNILNENKFVLHLMEAKTSILYSLGKINEAKQILDEIYSSPNLNSEMKKRIDILKYEFGKL